MMRGFGFMGALVFAMVIVAWPSSATAQVFGESQAESKALYWFGTGYTLLRVREDNFRKFFGDNTHGGFLQFGVNLLPRVDGTFAAGFALQSANTWATRQPDGIPVGAPGSNPTVRTLNKERLFLFPMQAGLRLRGQFWRDQFLVPFAEGGPAMTVFHDDFGHVNTGSITGVKFGAWAGAGLFVDVIDLDQRARRSLRADGFEHIYLFGAARYDWIDNFGGRGLDLSGYRFSFGVELRFRG
ncbi:MAG: hypothetical protein KIT79_03090 [Deltaproteobacteria bacterium]|nr:hypothetical protein [Deltaproteobacteria bacterium]